MPDVRWKQRFDNFSRAYELLREALEERPLESYSDLEQEGIIQRFEFTFELAWKTMKDFLEHGGLVISPVTPRAVVKEAFAAGVVRDGQTWIDMMLHRNLLSHTYDKKRFTEVLEAVRDNYLDAFTTLQGWFNEQGSEDA